MMVNPDYTDNAKALVNAQTGQVKIGPEQQGGGPPFRATRVHSLCFCGVALFELKTGSPHVVVLSRFAMR